MVLPATDRGRRSRDRILDAATRLIDERGVAATGLDQILADAGASKSQLYHYFEDKDDLVRAVIERRFEQMLESQAPLLRNLDTWAGIRRWLDMFVEQNEANGYPGCAMGTLASELARRDDAAREDLAGCFRVWVGYLAAGLERMRRRGKLARHAKPDDLATAVLASTQGGLLLAKTEQSSRPLRIALDAAFAHLRSFDAGQHRDLTATRER